MANLHGAVKKAWHQPDGWQTGTMDEEEGVHTTATVTVGGKAGLVQRRVPVCVRHAQPTWLAV